MDTKEEIKQFYELDAELRRKYMLVECLMLKNNNAASVRQSCTNINVLFNKLCSFARCIFTLSDVNSEGQPNLSCLDTSKFEFDKRIEDWFKSINFNSQNDDTCTVRSSVLPGQSVVRVQVFCVVKHMLRLSWHV